MKKIILITLFCYHQLLLFSQENSNSKQDSPSFFEKTYFGGGLGLQFGDITVINVSPLMGYQISDQFSAGIGLTYLYFNSRFSAASSNVFGGRVFGRYNIVEQLFIHSEYEILNSEAFNDFTLRYERRNIPAFLVGGGYRQQLGSNSFLNITVLWDLIQDPAYPYRNPIFRGGFTFGL